MHILKPLLMVMVMNLSIRRLKFIFVPEFDRTFTKVHNTSQFVNNSCTMRAKIKAKRFKPFIGAFQMNGNSAMQRL